MAEVDYMHLCDYAFQAEGGKPCIIGIFDTIGAASFPCTHPHMAIAIQLRGQSHEAIPVHVELGKPNGDVIATLDGQVTAGPDGGAFLNFNLLTLQFPEAGRYSIKVLSSGRVLASQSFRLHGGEAPGPAPAGTRH